MIHKKHRFIELNKAESINISGGALPVAVAAWKAAKYITYAAGAYLTATGAADASKEILAGYEACRDN